MATERLSMRHIREVLRQKWVQKRSHREVASSLGISAGAVGSVLARATAAKLGWEQVEQMREGRWRTRTARTRACLRVWPRWTCW